MVERGEAKQCVPPYQRGYRLEEAETVYQDGLNLQINHRLAEAMTTGKISRAALFPAISGERRPKRRITP